MWGESTSVFPGLTRVTDGTEPEVHSEMARSKSTKFQQRKFCLYRKKILPRKQLSTRRGHPNRLWNLCPEQS